MMTEHADEIARTDRKGTSDSVAAHLSHAIHEHRLAPGTKLGEDELCDIYGVSRTIVRAALQSLAHGQIVTIHRNRGAFVAQPTQRDAREVFEARELLEPRMAQAAARTSTPDQVAALEAHITQEHAAMAAGDPGRALSLSGQFHIEIARMANQATIADFITALVARSSLIIALYWRRESALCESHAHHALVRAIAARDAGRAGELMQSHLVDLHSALDLTPSRDDGPTLREVLGKS